MKSQNLFPMLIKWIFYIWELLQYIRSRDEMHDEMGVIVIVGEIVVSFVQGQGTCNYIAIRSLGFIYIHIESTWKNNLFIRGFYTYFLDP